MKKINIKKIGLGLMVVFVVFGLVGYIVKSKNKETIVDLGDGWKSYSHEEMGITVKIPEDAKIRFERVSGKGYGRAAYFSSGPISKVSAVAREVANKKPIDISKYRKSSEKMNMAESVFIEEFEINGRIAFIEFNSREDLCFINRVSIVDVNRIIDIYFSRKFGGSNGRVLLLGRYPESFYSQYPELVITDFSDENMKIVAQEYIRLIKSVIISLD